MAADGTAPPQAGDAQQVMKPGRLRDTKQMDKQIDDDITQLEKDNILWTKMITNDRQKDEKQKK